MSKRFIIIGVLIVALCAGLVGFNIFRGKLMASYFAGAGRPPVAVEAATVEAKTWKPGVEAIGTTRAQMGADLAVEAAGTVRAINFAAGDKAVLGQLLVQIDDSAERADMASAQASITLSQRQLDRVSELRKKGFSTQAAYDDAKAKLDLAQSAYARASAQADLKAIKAPFDGVLGIPQVNVGEFAEVGKVVVTLQDLDELKVDFTVPEAVAGVLKLGQTVRFGVGATDLPFTGALNGIDPKVDATTHLVSVQALLDNNEHKVLPGQFLRMRVDLGAEPNVLVLPQTAVISSLYGDYVFLIAREQKDGKETLTARQTYIETGRRDLGIVEVKSGLKAGDMVVGAGQNKLQSGAGVILQSGSEVSSAGGHG